MTQSRVCSYLTCNHKHVSREPTTFLHLPEAVRLRVYFYQADIPTTTAFDLEQTGAHMSFRASEGHSASASLSLFKLRLVHPTAKEDVIRCLLLYYPVSIWSGDITRTSLPWLLDAPWSFLKYGRRLTIILNMYGFTYRGAEFGRVRPNTNSLAISTGPEDWSVEAAHHFLPTWKSMIDRLETSQSSSELKLRVVCDVLDAETAEIVLGPLRGLRLPRLELRLNSICNRELAGAARRAVLEVTGHMPAASKPFRFLDLPTELRQHILSFTDLVTPFWEAQWDEFFYYQIEADPNRGRKRHQDFCNKEGSIYPPCICFHSPLSMFLVCRKMLQDARQVFYANNRIIIMSEMIAPVGQPTGPRVERFEAAAFLDKGVRCESLGNLNDMEIMFSPRLYSHLGIDHAILLDWNNAIQHAASHVKNLSLTLIMGTESSPGRDAIDFKDTLEESHEAIFGLYEQIVSPLQVLRNQLKDFFVQVGSPFTTDALDYERMEPLMEEQEQALERLVMGSDYDSVARGKLERRTSRWLSEMYNYGGDD